MKTKPTPTLPRDLDNALYLAMIDAVGESLAFRAVDAASRVLAEWNKPTSLEAPR